MTTALPMGPRKFSDEAGFTVSLGDRAPWGGAAGSMCKGPGEVGGVARSGKCRHV